MLLKSALKAWMPPILFNVLKGRSKYGWVGSYATWEDAMKECSGYDAVNILEKCKSALFKVKNGEAVHERDSVLFERIEYSWPLLAVLLRSALEHDGKLHILDFGGSLGSSYYQNREFLSSLKEFSWSIVEQPAFVACGKENFEDGILKFYRTIEACLKECKPNILILSSVLQYLEDPYVWLDKLMSLGVDYIVIDRTAFIKGAKDIITVQRVAPEIYKASYPCWGFNEERLSRVLMSKYRLLSDFEAFDRSNYQGMYFKGFMLIRKDLLKGARAHA